VDVKGRNNCIYWGFGKHFLDEVIFSLSIAAFMENGAKMAFYVPFI
jgi:hypothetical protein